VLHLERVFDRTHAGEHLGVLSLIVWLLVLVVAIKYIVFIMRADNRGEGGILALMALISPTGATHDRFAPPVAARRARALRAALLYGDGIITTAISVLSAVEGLGVATPAFRDYVVPISLTILFALFTVPAVRNRPRRRHVRPDHGLVVHDHRPALGSTKSFRAPRIFAALNPWHGVAFFAAHRHVAFLALGAVVLAVTGAEALYADNGPLREAPDSESRGSPSCSRRWC